MHHASRGVARARTLLLVGGSSLALASLIGTSTSTGCAPDPDQLVNYVPRVQTVVSSGAGGMAGASGTGGDGANGGQTADNPQEFFELFVKGGGPPSTDNGLIENCTEGDCHASSSKPYFLPAGSEYEAITGFVTKSGKKLVVPNAAQSLLLTYPVTGTPHTGAAVWADENLAELYANTLEWLELEATPCEPGDEPPGCLPNYDFIEIGPIDVAPGINVFPLSQPFDIGGQGCPPADPENPGAECVLSADCACYPGASIVFYATEFGSGDDLALELTELKVYPAYQRALRIKDPSFAIQLPDDGNPDNGEEADPNKFIVDNSLQGDSVVYYIGEQGAGGDDGLDPNVLGTGELVLTQWVEGAKLAIQFTSIDLLYSDGQGTTFDACKQPLVFAEACDELAPVPNNPTNGPLLCADMCHGGNDAAATDAMDLSALLADPIDYDFGCAIMRQFITAGNVDESLIISLTMPQVTPPHPFIFEGSTSKWNTFKNGMSDWIEGE